MHPAEELWISRAIDRRASVEDWRGLEQLAAGDESVWRRLSATLRAETLLAHRVQALLPPGDEDSAAPTAPAASAAARARTGARRAAAGAAALLALATSFALGRASAGDAAAAPGSVPGSTTDAPAPAGSAERLLADYLEAGRESGRVLEQLPLQAIASERRADGRGLDVVFVRTIVERAHVEQGVRLASDEHGMPTALPVDLAHYLPPTDF